MAALDAQYGSLSSRGDTGIEGARRDASISTRDAQYYASRDTSWAGTLSGSATIGNTPWTLKAIAAANAQAAYSTNRANAQAAHDAALLSAIDNWQTSNRSSTLSLLVAEGQSREAYNKATATVYANWELGIGNLLGDKPAGTEYVPARGFGEGGVGARERAGGGVFTRFEEGEDETTTSGEEVDNVEPPRPTLPAPESSNSQPLIITVTDSPKEPPGAGQWILERGRVVESCLSGKTLYCVGEWQATDSQSRNFLTEVVQPPRVDVIFIPLDQFPSRGRAYFEDDILVADSIKDIAIAAGFDPSKKISVYYKTSQSAYPLDRLSEWTDGDKTLWALESRYVKNGVSVHCGYQFFSSPEEMYRQIQAMNLEIFNAGATAMTGSAGSLQTVKPLTRANPLTTILGGAPSSGKLSNVDARKWYLEQEAKILGEIDPNLPLRDRAVQAFNRRNELRTQARELMADRELADKLMREEPNMTLRDLVKRKYQQKGLVGDELWQDILDSSQKSRTSVNKKLGLE